MTEEERAERLRSGQLRLSNRMGWAVVDLEKAGYLSYGDERGAYRITQAGREFLGRHGGHGLPALFSCDASHDVLSPNYRKGDSDISESPLPKPQRYASGKLKSVITRSRKRYNCFDT